MSSCSNPMAPNEEELLAFVADDEMLGEESLRHLEYCPICQQRLKDCQHLHKRLLSGSFRALCPDPTQLMLYSEGVLPADEASAVSAHLRECLLCRDEVRDMRWAIVHFLPFPEPSVTDFILKVAKEGLRLLFARPISEQETAVVLRQDPAAPSWPLRYEAGQYKLSFQLSRTQHDRLSLIGFFEDLTLEQLQSFQGAGVDLYHAPSLNTGAGGPAGERPQPLLSTAVDDVGNFVFTAVPPGQYVVIIRLPDTELAVEGLSIT